MIVDQGILGGGGDVRLRGLVGWLVGMFPVRLSKLSS